MITRKRLWLMIGTTILAVLLAILLPTYRSIILKSREAALKTNLFEMRLAIDHYIKNRHEAPHSLQNLVDAGYFRQLPIDPLTNSSSWKAVTENVVVSPGQADRVITDVHSASTSISSNGTAYDTW